MPTLFARRYLRKPAQVSTTEKLLGILILLLTAGIVSAFVLHTATSREFLFEVQAASYGEAEGAGAAANPFPDPGLAGWRAPRAAERLSADDLYLKIDGQAAAYLHYGAVALTCGSYEHESDSDRTIDVYWYDMGTAENALLMYKSEEPPEAVAVALGSAGYQVGGAVFLCQGSSYVQVMPSTVDEADAQVALAIADRVAQRIGGE